MVGQKVEAPRKQKSPKAGGLFLLSVRNLGFSSLSSLAFTFISQAATKSNKGGEYLPKGPVD